MVEVLSVSLSKLYLLRGLYNLFRYRVTKPNNPGCKKIHLK